MTIRRLLPLALLSSILVLSACGNKGPLLPPPAPEDEEWLEDPAVEDDASDEARVDDGSGDDAGDEAGDADDEDPVPADGGDDGDGGA